MRHRSLGRRSFVVGGVLSLVGCVTQPEPSTPTDQSTSTPTRTQAQGLGTIEFTVTNRDDTTHRLTVEMENAEGRVVLETNEPEFEPGSSVSSGSAGEPPENGPFTLTFSTESSSSSYVWDVWDCGRINLDVTITTMGELTIERDLCQN